LLHSVADTQWLQVSHTFLIFFKLSLPIPPLSVYFSFESNTQLTTLSPVPPLDPRPIIISGPSGVGKGTLYALLLSRHPSTFCTSISNTTRDPRPGEIRDKDYYYISMSEFEKMIEEEGFVEHAKFGGNRYGTSKKMLEEKKKGGEVVVLDIEMEVTLFSYCSRSMPVLILWKTGLGSVGK
jgi:hypothetical protein